MHRISSKEGRVCCLQETRPRHLLDPVERWR